MKTKIGTELTCCLLALLLLFTGVFFPGFGQKAYATSNDDNFESYLTGNNIPDSYIEEVDIYLVEKYQEYVHYDTFYIEMETTEVEEKYGEIIYDYSIDTAEYVENEEDIFDIAAVRMIRRKIASDLVAFFSSDILGYLVSLGSWAVDILTSSNVAWKVFEIVYGILMPSISDCVIVLYYAMAEYRGVELKLCWIPTWWDKWGLSIKTL